jgi:hypothetical protein
VDVTRVRTRRAVALVVAIAIGGGLLTACIGDRDPASSPATRAAPTTVLPKRSDLTTVERQGSTLLATTRGSIPAFVAPGGARRGTVPGSWFGAPSTLPVIDGRPGWWKVRLAQRPNGSTAWVLARDVTLASSPYRIIVELARRRVTLLRNERVITSVPAGVGTASSPTPTGHYFLALFARPPQAAYGAFVMVTSGHSTTITDWERSGDALIAIHGPLGSDRAIGATGAAVSHGCVRLHEPDLEQLRVVPVGSPVDILG